MRARPDALTRARARARSRQRSREWRNALRDALPTIGAVGALAACAAVFVDTLARTVGTM